MTKGLTKTLLVLILMIFVGSAFAPKRKTKRGAVKRFNKSGSGTRLSDKKQLKYMDKVNGRSEKAQWPTVTGYGINHVDHPLGTGTGHTSDSNSAVSRSDLSTTGFKRSKNNRIRKNDNS